MKSVFKEIIIVLLLILVILLILGILFYDYMPNSKMVPEKVTEYAMEETVKKELDNNLNNAESDKIIRTYQLDSTDISNYEKTKEYNKGKVNPFDQYSSGTTGSTNNGGTTGNENNNSSSGNSSNTNTEQDPSKDNFLGTTGK